MRRVFVCSSRDGPVIRGASLDRERFRRHTRSRSRDRRRKSRSRDRDSRRRRSRDRGGAEREIKKEAVDETAADGAPCSGKLFSQLTSHCFCVNIVSPVSLLF